MRVRFIAALALVLAVAAWARMRPEPTPPVYAWSTHQLRSVLTSWGACNFGPSDRIVNAPLVQSMSVPVSVSP